MSEAREIMKKEAGRFKEDSYLRMPWFRSGSLLAYKLGGFIFV